ncbi:MAG TPA: hypothetical protein VIS99_02810, partial [Terrimicrobiaceae bacterium]
MSPIAVLPSLDRGDMVADIISKVIAAVRHVGVPSPCGKNSVRFVCRASARHARSLFLSELLSVRLQGLQESLLVLHVWKTNSRKNHPRLGVKHRFPRGDSLQ